MESQLFILSLIILSLKKRKYEELEQIIEMRKYWKMN